LPAGGSCLLGSLNLSAFVENPFTDKAAFNIPEFKKAVRIAVRALNEVLDEGLPLHPLQIQRETVRDWRQIGLGIMGFADTVLMLGHQYGDEGSKALIDLIGKALVDTGLHESSVMAKESEPFPKCDNNKVIGSNYIGILYTYGVISEQTLAHISKYGLRNSQLFTIAPTGSISTMLGISGGVEPIFATHYTRKTQALHGEDTYYKVYTPIVDTMLKKGIINEYEVDNIITAQTMNPFDRVEIQGRWQEYIDASISSTVNLTEDATPELIEELYISAWKEGCKGLTVYRAGCKKGAVLEVKSEEKQEEKQEETQLTEQDYAIENCQGFGTKLQTGCGSLWVTAYFHKSTGRLCHIFLDKGSCGGCNSFMIGLSRMISLAGKKGATIPEIIDQLNSVPACPSYAVRAKTKKDTSKGTCCPSAIGIALKQLYEEFLATRQPEVNNKVKPQQEEKVTNPCPDCGCELVMTEGCNSCPSCGYTKCS
jgi:ribonucleoside-diphosphate reductase alpha chain